MKTGRYGAVLLVFLLAACGREEVTVYQIPKEDSSQAPVLQAANSTPKITWTTPKEWQEQPATEMRQGSFLVSGSNGMKADISVSGFPGDAGGDLANVNRWRSQIKLPPLDEAAMETAALKIDMGGEPALQFTLDEKPDGSGHKVIGVILHHGDETWFFKMTGDAALVTAQQGTFSDFLKAIRFAAGEKSDTQTNMPAPPPFADTPSGGAKPKWTLPSGWQEQPAANMRVGSFIVAEGDRKADVSVVMLAGDAGGMLANINRWRGQLSLPETTEADLASLTAKIPVDGSMAIIVDMAGEKTHDRILGAIIERGGNTWFVKMTGEDSLVEKHKPDFLNFVKSLQFPDND